MSCLLFNLSLQPLLDLVLTWDSGVLLPWDTSQMSKISSLAFADDVLILVQSHRDIQCFEEALEMYELASNAKLNKDKSLAFVFWPPTAAACSVHSGGIRDKDIPFPILGHNHKEIKHLGYPICLDGGIPEESISQVLQAIKAKIQTLGISSSMLLGQVQICNTFLLAKLWHVIHICPLLAHLDRQVCDLLNPYLFKGYHNWLWADIISLP